ncbi:glycosyltransferase 25 family member [Diabrotica virgifera virgifera]|uniref:Glycosyl transferase family 25 domain-containing protein n=3 Tax=Diabrotica virgifera virgifera TaxID=50390 RepID=A0ABM5JME3_DIAVI|nr:glycosyltransferase 25 family member [Diabrotica virgifera virgifera]
MKFLNVLVLVLVIMSNSHAEKKQPTILVSILVRNKAHTLPYFLSNFESLNYPKDRMALWIRSDHNTDNSLEIIRQWISSVKFKYHSINTEFIEDGTQYPGEHGPAHWTNERFNHIINLRESALEFAKNIWADFLLSLDCDVFLTNPDTLNYLVSKNYTIVAPMLRAEGLYSNFWHGMTDDYYYQRTEEYTPVLRRENQGCFTVPMVHSCVLIDLRRRESEYLTYVPSKIDKFDGPNDDIIAFAISANRSAITLNICNELKFGYIMVPLEQNDQLSVDYEQMTNMKLDVLNEINELYVNDLLKKFVRELPRKDTLGFDKIFMINLLRRPERRKRMKHCFDELGLEVDILDAVDGKALNESFLEEIKFMPEFSDPYHKRPMKLGEIGCFMSHLNIWKEIVEERYGTTLVLEDDIRFEPFFRHKVQNLMAEVRRIPNWDLVYFGRKRLQENDEPWVDGSNFLVHAGYSYWTLGYALSFRGAKKLLEGDPLTRLVPVDEYLPILFDKHPQDSWKGYYPKRDLVAFSAAPLLIYPTHYTGEKGYISDTEDSVVIPELATNNREDL